MPAYDFARLSSFDFEELTCDLLQAEWRARLESFTAGRDSGIDLRGYTDTKHEAIIQCKHLAGSNFQKLHSLLRREELPKVKKLAPKRYVVVTSVGLTPENKKKLVKLFHPYIRRQSDIIGRSELNSLLRRHKAVETANFKLWLTSTEVLQRVLFNAERWQTEFEVDRVARMLPLFVQNDAFPRAQKILEESRVVVISGIPGIGKTTLADMILYAHLEQGYEPVVVQSGIEGAKKQYNIARKQIFYFDDFLGQTFLHERPDLISQNQDAALVSFMEAIRLSKASRFILTTREHILRKALSASERLGRSNILDHKCVLELKDYTFGQKARILYNHLFFSDLPEPYKRAVLKDEFYFQVIRHRNFVPRLIEWLSGYARVRSVEAKDYQKHISALLDDPAHIWLHAFDEQITEAARSLLLCLGATTLWGANLKELELAWESLHRYKSQKYNFSMSANDFQRSLADLEGAFVTFDQRRVKFLNPSIREFVENLFRNTKSYLLDVIASAVRFQQIIHLRRLSDGKKTKPLDEVFAPCPEIIAALNRLVGQPHVEWSKSEDGTFTGTYIDSTPETRVSDLVTWAEEKKSSLLLPLIEIAVEHLKTYWSQYGVNIAPTVLILEAIEDSQWVYENGGASTYRQLLDKCLGNLYRATNYHWEVLLRYRRNTKLWTQQDYADVRDSLREYRKTGIYAEYEECATLSELEGLRESLHNMQKNYRVSFKKTIRAIDADIKLKRLTEEPDDEESQPISPSPRQPEDEEEVRRLFGSLI